MIEISHKQARHLLRNEMDRRLPEEQWTTLQAHLENCAECRVYRDRLGIVERDLRRTLRGGWESVPGPGVQTPLQVVAARRRQMVIRKRMLTGGMALVGLVLLFFLSRSILNGEFAKMIPRTSDSSAADVGDPNLTPTVAIPAATPVPLAKAGDFPDVVVYEARKDGKADQKKQIYLLNPGSDPVDLFNGTSNESNPAWSPDGEWIAFLSDRTGKDELFVTNLTSNKVVQITNNPGVTWQGPLSWSADGKWIALTGVRDQQGGQHWVYIVPLDGSGARALSGTRDGASPKFSPFGDRLALTFADGTHSGVMIYHVETGEKVTTHWQDNPAALLPAPGSAFDWSADGTGLAYLALDSAKSGDSSQSLSDSTTGTFISPGSGSGGSGSQVVVVRETNSSGALSFDFIHNLQIAQSVWPGAFHGVNWTANGLLVYLEDLNDARANDKPGTTTGGCWSIQAHFLGFRGNFNGDPNNNNSSRTGNNGSGSNNVTAQALSINNMCVEGGLDRESWTPDGRWLVVLGRLPGETQRSLYAVRMPGRGFGFERNLQSFQRPITPTPTNQARPSTQPRANTSAQFNQPPVGATLRLVSAMWDGPLPRVRPRLYPYSQPVDINPQPVAKSKPVLPPSDLSHRPNGPAGQIVYTVQNNAVNVVVRANPDGTGGQVLEATQGTNRCPRLSPDGKSLALVAPFGNYISATSTGGGKLQAADVTGPQDNYSAPNDEIYTMDADGGNVTQVSLLADIPNASGPAPIQVSYGCPVWSPDWAPGGPYVAALVNTSRQWYLAILPVPGSDTSARRYIMIGDPVKGLGPIWSPDGRSLYLVERTRSQPYPALYQVTLPDSASGPLSSSIVNVAEDWSRVNAMTLDPNGKAVIVLELSNLRAGDSGQALLRRVSFADPGGGNLLGSPMSPDKEGFSNPIQSGDVILLYNSHSTIGLLLKSDASDTQKAAIYRSDLSYGLVKKLAEVEDALGDMAWSPDGEWLVYSTESGLWGLDVVKALQGKVGPVWLSPMPVQGLDWK